jgi:hypothetical protein
MAGASLQAHHSLAGVYDMKAEKEIAGTLTAIKFVNPHGSMTITVKNPTARRPTGRSRPARHDARRSRDQQSRPECAQGGRGAHGEVHSGAQRRSAGLPQVDYARRRQCP